MVYDYGAIDAATGSAAAVVDDAGDAAADFVDAADSALVLTRKDSGWKNVERSRWLAGCMVTASVDDDQNVDGHSRPH